VTRRRSPAPAGWTSTPYLLLVSSNFPPNVLSAGFRDEVDERKQIELFASFCCMVGDGGAGRGGSHSDATADRDPRKVVGSTVASSSRKNVKEASQHHVE
jgi:hypothetical protein